MLVARIVRSPDGEVSVAPERMNTGPLTTTTPSRFMFEVTSSDASAHVPLAASQPEPQTWLPSHAVPPALHCSDAPPLQRRDPGVHAPTHRPLEHALAHVVECRYAVPLELQISTARPLHRCAPGVHVTLVWQVPDEQPNAQLCVSYQVPLVHCSMLLLAEQRVAPFVHVVHEPDKHVCEPQDTGSLHARQPLPGSLQVSTPSTVDEQRVAPALEHSSVHWPGHASPRQSPSPHACGSEKSVQPDVCSSHTCTRSPAHRVEPTVH
ncbi:MAG: hypothetical protein H6Q90_7289 [Deltaproteobacteria bacterium]|nr:hypothetical protein [Deltaproteobacteria bacterium]